MAERYTINRRQFIQTAPVLPTALWLAACGAQNSQSGGSKPDAYPQRLTQPTVEAMQRNNFDLIKEANIGDVLTVPEYVIHGFQEVGVWTIPLIQDSIRDRAVFSLRHLNADPSKQRYASWVIGAGCLTEYAKINGFLDGAKDINTSEFGVSAHTLQISKPVILQEITARVGLPIPGTEGAKVLYLMSYKAYNQTASVSCQSDSATIEQDKIVTGFLGAELQRSRQ